VWAGKGEGCGPSSHPLPTKAQYTDAV